MERPSPSSPAFTRYASVATRDETKGQMTSNAFQEEPKDYSYLPTHEHHAQRHNADLTYIWWKPAIAAFLLVASAVAIFATLYPFNGQPLPDWPYAVSIGALLSIYTVILRACAVYLLADGLAQLKWAWFGAKMRPLRDLDLHDEATRGPIGAIHLLWQYPLPQTWQWFGCAFLLLTVLVGPLTQQTLQYETCSIPATDPGSILDTPSIARASIFASQGFHSGAAFKTSSMSEQRAINAGVYTPGQVDFNCPTGNCTFPTYASVGYCSQTIDATSNLRTVVSNQSYVVQDSMEFDNGTTVVTNITYWQLVSNTSLPNGQINLFTYDLAKIEMGNPSTLGNFATFTGDSVIIGYPGMQNPYDGNKEPCPYNAATGHCFTGCNETDTNDPWHCRRSAAATWSFYPCLRTYNATVVNGVLNETVLSETSNDFLQYGPAMWSNDQLYLSSAILRSCLSPKQRDALTRFGYNPSNSTDTWMLYSSSQAASASSAQTAMEKDLVASGCLYGIDFFWIRGMPQYLGSPAFYGNLTGEAVGEEDPVILDFAGTALTSSIYNAGNFSFARTQSLFRNMSLSLTNYMRQTPGLNMYVNSTLNTTGTTAYAKGIASTTKTCLRISWPWLVLPYFVVLATLMFSVAASIKVAREMGRDVASWKLSALPLIFHGPLSEGQGRSGEDDGVAAASSSMSSFQMGGAEDDTLQVSPAGEHISDLVDAARGMQVRLRRTMAGTMGLLREK